MLTDQEYSLVNEILNRYTALVTVSASNQPYDYHSLFIKMTHLELTRELKQLKQLFAESKDDFKAQVQARCLVRSQDSTRNFNFADFPVSPCNKLYMELVNILFPKESVSIILPQAKTLVRVQFSERLLLPNLRDNRITQAFEALYPDFVEVPLQAFPLEDLPYYAVAGELLFDIRDLQNFPRLTHQKKIYEHLKNNYPELAVAIYHHNPELYALRETLIDSKTPEEAILHLIKMLALGGTSITGRDFATDSANNAFEEFRDYFKKLPKELRKDLKSLVSATQKSLAAVISDLKQRKCAETAAKDLQAILAHNPNHNTLKRSVTKTPTELKQTQWRFQENLLNLNTTKDPKCLTQLPTELVKTTLQSLAFKNLEDLIQLLISLPDEFYNDLLAHGNFNHINKPLMGMLKAIEYGFFADNSKKKEAFIKVIVANWQRFDIKEFLYAAAIPELLEPLLKSLPKEKIKELLKFVDDDKRTILLRAAEYPQSFALLLAYYPNDTERLNAFLAEDDLANTVLHLAGGNPNALKYLLDFYSTHSEPAQFLSFVLSKNFYGNTILHQEAYNPETLKLILKSLPPENRLKAMQKTNDLGEFTVLQLAAQDNNSESIRAILELLPESDRPAAIKTHSYISKETVLHTARNNPEILKIILEFLPESERLTVVKLLDETGLSVFSFAKPESIKTILSLLPEADQFALMKKDANQNSELLGQLIEEKMFDQVFLNFDEKNGLALYVRVHQIIQPILSQKANQSSSGFFDSSEIKLASKLQAALFKSNDTTDTKKAIFEFLGESLNSKAYPIQVKLLNQFVDAPELSYAEKLNLVTVKWSIDTPISYDAGIVV